MMGHNPCMVVSNLFLVWFWGPLEPVPASHELWQGDEAARPGGDLLLLPVHCSVGEVFGKTRGGFVVVS